MRNFLGRLSLSLTNGEFPLLRVLELVPEPLERVGSVHVLGEGVAVDVRAASRIGPNFLQFSGGAILLTVV